MEKPRSVFIGFDAREAQAFAVAKDTAEKNLSSQAGMYGAFKNVHGLVLEDLQKRGLYTRKTVRDDGGLWDEISQAPMSTEFAISRFLVPTLARHRFGVPAGFALFMDCDVLVRSSLDPLFDLAEQNPDKAVFCVKHKHEPKETVKMDGQMQQLYARKNWSSVMLFNCDHPANAQLDAGLVNAVPGRDLHRFCWLKDEEIGELPPEWNYLVGHTDKSVEPKIVHFTEGGPWFDNYKDVEYAQEWNAAMSRWAAQ